MPIQIPGLLFWAFFTVAIGLRLEGQEYAGNVTDPVAMALEQRVTDDPGDATAWRLIGRLKLDRQMVDEAIVACGRAVELSPESASGHFDLARALLANDENDEAAIHFAQVIQLAPQSDYGAKAAAYLQTLGYDSNMVPPRAEIEPNRFGGITFDKSRQQKRWAATFDIGAAYNSNVQLAPILREALNDGSGSAQFFMAPGIESILMEKSEWESGIVFNGYFAFNEAHVQEFDLQEYQPGVFVERLFSSNWPDLILRSQYDFSLNQFQGVTFGQRHSITTSLLLDHPNFKSFVYWTIDLSDFSDDGLIPDQTSLDGLTNTIGASHSAYDTLPMTDVIRYGIDLQLADLAGSDYSYRGVFAYMESESKLPFESCFEFQLGAGYRDYPDFTGVPSRNETLWRASAQISRDLTPGCRLTVFSTYDRFASDNELYDATRNYSGLMTTFRW